MTKALFFFVALAVAIEAQLIGPSIQPSESAASIRGVIRDSGGNPIVGVKVWSFTNAKFINGVVVQNKETKEIQSLTDDHGEYSLSNLHGGTYRVYADRESPTRQQMIRTIIVIDRQLLTGVDFTFESYSSIHGRVMDQDRIALPNIKVVLAERQFKSGVSYAFIRDIATTNGAGEYSFIGVAPGRTYWILAEGRFKLRSVSDVPEVPQRRSLVLSSTWYPNSKDIEVAIPLFVQPGARLEDIDVKMASGVGYCIVASVQPAGEMEGLSIQLDKLQATMGAGVFVKGETAPVPKDGQLRVCGLTNGEYRLSVFRSKTAANGDTFEFGRIEATIRDEDLTRAVVTTSKGIETRVEVAWDGTPPDPPINAVATLGLEPLSRALFSGEQISGRASVPDSFTIRPVAEKYSLRPFVLSPTTSGLYIKDVTYGGVSILQSTLQIGAALGGGEVRVVVGRDGGTINVIVTDKNHNPAQDGQVILTPAKPVSEGDLANSLVKGTTDQNGFWTVNNARPGKYRLLAVPASLSITPNFVRSLFTGQITQGKEIEVVAAATVQASVEITRVEP